jgi:predicted nucleic acid-binding protein
MPIKFVLVDTNIWHYIYNQPKEDQFVELQEKSRQFMKNILTDASIKIALSSYQCAEIIELLRRSNQSKQILRELIEDFKREKFTIVNLDFADFLLASDKSIASGIHIYDYLVALPLKNIVTEIYSADDHFQHPDFKEIAPVINPLHPWILREGKIPVKS